MTEEKTSMNGFSLDFNSHLPDVPSANDILSLKMLKDVNKEVFEPMYKDQVNFMTAARGLLVKDPFLQTKLGGTGLDAVSKLAKILRKRSNDLFLQERIDDLVKNVNKSTIASTEGSSKLQKVKASEIHDGKEYEKFYVKNGSALKFKG